MSTQMEPLRQFARQALAEERRDQLSGPADQAWQPVLEKLEQAAQTDRSAAEEQTGADGDQLLSRLLDWVDRGLSRRAGEERYIP